MKISNEFKIGALTIFAVLFLFLGFNFLKGKNIFKNGFFLYAKFSEAKGLQTSNPVTINGYQAGTVYSLQASKDLKEILVEIKLNKDFEIPATSLASISSNPIGSSSLEITLGDDSKMLNSGDTLRSTYTAGLLGQVSSQIVPLADQAKMTLHSADSLINNFNAIVDENTRYNTQQTIANLSRITGSLVQSVNAINQLLDAQSGTVAAAMNSMNAFAGNLAANNGRINSTMTNVETTTQNLSNLQLQRTLDRIDSTIATLNVAVAQLNSTNGTVGALINDRKFYDQLSESARSLQILMDDLRVNPKRYVHFSLFGKKNNNNYLKKPLQPTTGYTPLNADTLYRYE